MRARRGLRARDREPCRVVLGGAARLAGLTGRRVAATVRAVLRAERKSLRLAIRLVHDLESRRLNRRFLGHDWSTDVIAFDLRDDEVATGPDDLDGEVVVNVARAAREARHRGHPAVSESLFYVAHGVLHLCGHEDGTPARRTRMLERQREILLGIGVELAD